MVVGEIAEPVDLLVVGGGPGGYAAALRAAELGREVTLVDRGGIPALGGCCLHVGCIPSKALIELAEGRAQLDALAPMGLSCAEVTVDLGRFQEAKGELVGRLARGVAQLVAAGRISVLEGDLRFSLPDRAAVVTPDGNVTHLEFRDAIVATGSRPAQLAALPVDGERVLDSTGLLELAAVPERLAVVGAGTIGVELGTAMAKLGARVTMIEARERLLPELDAAVGEPVARRLAELGVEVELGARVVGIDGDALALQTPGGDRRVAADTILVAIGRRPNTDALGLDLAGVDVEPSGLIAVGADLRATGHIAAIGDVVAGPALAHKATHQGRVAAEALSGLPVAFEPAGIPLVVFSDPEIAVVGLSEAQARAAGLDVAMASFPLTASGRAATLGQTRGFARLVVDRGADRVAGVQIVAPHASELIAEGTLAVEMMASPADVAATIHAHPTLSEALGEAALLLDRRAARERAHA
jgi:dihydrolipoamide dehydrogenase